MVFCFPIYCKNHSDEELADKIEQLNNFSNTSPLDSSQKDKELNLLTEIIFKSSDEQLQSQDLESLLTFAIRNLMKYSNLIFHTEIEVCEKKRTSRYQTAKENYKKLLNVMSIEKSEEIAKIIMNIIYNKNIWESRRFCADLFNDSGVDASEFCLQICNKIEFSVSLKNTDAKLMVKVLYDLLEFYKWPNNRETVVFLERLLNLYYKSLDDENTFYPYLRGSLELCLRYIIRNISNDHRLITIKHMSSWAIKENINDDFILNYGSTLEYAACLHEGNSFTSEIFTLLMKMIGSKIRFVSLLGNRVFHYLIDRNENQLMFNTPKIFFEGMILNLKLIEYNREDMKFLEKHREMMHESLINSIINHKHTRLNLETTYCTICLLAIAVPCGFTAAAISCLVMNLQEIIMKRHDKSDRKATYHIHAIIISVLSFICWIYKAKDFHAYVNKIIMERAQWAPHLNPPLQWQYNFAVHHVLWEKPELFPIAWEVRYGLWKRFRLDQSIGSKNENFQINQ